MNYWNHWETGCSSGGFGRRVGHHGAPWGTRGTGFIGFPQPWELLAVQVFFWSEPVETCGTLWNTLETVSDNSCSIIDVLGGGRRVGSLSRALWMHALGRYI